MPFADLPDGGARVGGHGAPDFVAAADGHLPVLDQRRTERQHLPRALTHQRVGTRFALGDDAEIAVCTDDQRVRAALCRCAVQHAVAQHISALLCAVIVAVDGENRARVRRLHGGRFGQIAGVGVPRQRSFEQGDIRNLHIRNVHRRVLNAHRRQHNVDLVIVVFRVGGNGRGGRLFRRRFRRSRRGGRSFRRRGGGFSGCRRQRVRRQHTDNHERVQRRINRVCCQNQSKHHVCEMPLHGASLLSASIIPPSSDEQMMNP